MTFDMYYLFLDDERSPDQVTWVFLPNAHWHIVRSYDEFVRTVEEKGIPAFVSFDHDLADEHYEAMSRGAEEYDYGSEKTGYDCATWLVEYIVERGLFIPVYEVHSMNPSGGERIRACMENGRKYDGLATAGD